MKKFLVGRSEKLAFASNLCLIIMEVYALFDTLRFCPPIFFLIFYTQISNILALVGSVIFLFRPRSKLSSALRFLATVMLTMTMVITAFVLVPMGGNAKILLLVSPQIFHHMLCPIVSLISYLCWEQNEYEPQILPLAVTFAYGLPILILNGMEKLDGPYPFFRVNEQGVPLTILWMVLLFLLVFGFEMGIKKIRNIIQKK